MTSRDNKRAMNWSVGQSILLELGFSIVLNYLADYAEPMDSADWRKAWSELWGETWNPGAIIVHLAILSDSITETSYSDAVAAARQMGVQDALNRAVLLGEEVAVRPDSSLLPLERLVDLSVRTRMAAHENSGLSWNPDQFFAERTAGQFRMLTRLLKEGDLHERFWTLLDEYYSRFYEPWRHTRIGELNIKERLTTAQLQGCNGDKLPEDLSWITPQHPLFYLIETSGKIGAPVFFWVDPFRFTAMSIHPNLIVVTYDPGTTEVEEERNRAQEVASRIRALGDPTRLMILKMIRRFGMDNTGTARALGVSRPTVSNHIKLLQEAGLVETRIVGRSAKHFVNSAQLQTLVKELLQYVDIDK